MLVVDEKVADAFTAPGDDVERMRYGWSVTHCLPTQLVEHPSAALTVMRADTVRELADQAGYTRVDVLPSTTTSSPSTGSIPSPTWRPPRPPALTPN